MPFDRTGSARAQERFRTGYRFLCFDVPLKSMLEGVRCVLLCMLETVEGELYLLEALEVLRCVLKLWRVGSVC